MNEHEHFLLERRESVATYRSNERLKEATGAFAAASIGARYSYNFDWMGRPIIQYPQDIVAMQELVWSVQPDLIIECGVAHGGSLILSASLLALNELGAAAVSQETVNPKSPKSKVIGIDIDIRSHNRSAIEQHPLSSYIELIQGSSIDSSVVEQVKEAAKGFKRTLVCLDSNHTHEHVLAELEAYAPLTSKGSYCVVFDTIIEDLPEELYPDRPWAVGDNPKTAVASYLRRLEETAMVAADGEPLQLAVDQYMEDKLQVTVAPGGYLKRV
ncbi:MAG: cephalosporin hydroxylase family protein [Pseudomonadota bacterium]